MDKQESAKGAKSASCKKHISDYLKGLQSTLSTQKATEHSHRAALAALFQALLPGVSALNEPKRQGFGAPDFVLLKGAGRVSTNSAAASTNNSATASTNSADGDRATASTNSADGDRATASTNSATASTNSAAASILGFMETKAPRVQVT